VIVGASGLTHAADLSDFERTELVSSLATLETACDVMVIDCGAGISQNVLAFAQAAGELLLVTTPEPTALTDAYTTIKVLASTQGRRDLRVVVNQVTRPGDGRTIRGQLQQVVDRYVTPNLDAPVKLEFLGEIATDKTVREAVTRRQLLLEAFPGCPAAQSLVAVATRLTA
jgi:flagellar biosynthesis protein FlhG